MGLIFLFAVGMLVFIAILLHRIIDRLGRIIELLEEKDEQA